MFPLQTTRTSKIPTASHQQVWGNSLLGGMLRLCHHCLIFRIRQMMDEQKFDAAEIAVGFETLVKTLLSKLRKVKRQQKRLKNKLDTGVQITKEFKEETLKKRGSLVDVAQSLHAYSGSHHLVLCTASTCFMQEGSLHHIYISKNIGAQDKHFLCKYLSFYTSSMN
ncbi:uncharacterized protein LOC142557118 isoform X2 [Dermacentor variabilis]|uniref:uncharacterized protein LOC142557118 isoform X2 n=1 Tax=Dermacentor variabilis TaxID=34621 RepID=UPI003F5BAA45